MLVDVRVMELSPSAPIVVETIDSEPSSCQLGAWFNDVQDVCPLFKDRAVYVSDQFLPRNSLVAVPWGDCLITGLVVGEHTEPLTFPADKLKPVERLLYVAADS